MDDEEKKEMRQKEKGIMKKIGVFKSVKGE